MKVKLGKYPDYNEETQIEPEREIEVKIDKWDVWNLDHTLALIIAPSLKLLKKQKHGAPCVDNKDVPKKLRMSKKAKKKYNTDGSTDKKFFKRYDYVLDEMIWAFEQHASADDEEQFHTGEHDMLWIPVDAEGDEVPEDKVDDFQMYRMTLGPNDTHVFDKKGHAAHWKRKENGLRLFAKYYFSLQD